MESDTWTGYFEEKITEAIQYGRETISRFFIFLKFITKTTTIRYLSFSTFLIHGSFFPMQAKMPIRALSINAYTKSKKVYQNRFCRDHLGTLQNSRRYSESLVAKISF